MAPDENTGNNDDIEGLTDWGLAAILNLPEGGLAGGAVAAWLY